MDIKIIVAAHKKYQMPEDAMYLPLQVGAAGKDSIGFARDDQGENISEKNPFFCELTGMYYAWKNLDADAIGLVHYRRHFTNKSKTFRKKHGSFESILTEDEATAFLTRADVIVPGKRKYYIENLYSHYAHTLDGKHLDLARDIIEKTTPEFLPYVDRAYSRTWGYMFNMLVAKKDYFDDYCQWLFPILFEMEKEIDVSGMDAFSARLFGRVSEILFNAWVMKKEDQGMTIVECRVMDMEPVNWIKKGAGFLSAKFFGKKYSKSM